MINPLVSFVLKVSEGRAVHFDSSFKLESKLKTTLGNGGKLNSLNYRYSTYHEIG